MTGNDKTFLRNTTASFIAAHGSVATFWVALSGGLDSVVLLHLLAQIKPQPPVRVLHVNHQLSGHASQWQAHCQALAESLGFPFIGETVSVPRSGQGLEMAAREARYAAFAHHLAPSDMLLTAHHLDDQAETLLLRLLRGAGVRGLGAMAPVRPFNEGWLGRPLLAASRAQLLAYARAEGLQWVEDESNQRVAFDRNFLRIKVLPQVAERWPGFAQRWAQTAALARETDGLLQEYLADDLQAADRRPERLGESVDLHYLADVSLPRRNALLRHWIQVCGYLAPDQALLGQTEQFLRVDDDGQPLVAWDGCELRRFNQRLFLVPRLPRPRAYDLVWGGEALTLPDASLLDARHAASGLRTDLDYRICLRHGGERCQPHGRAHSQKLKKLLQEYRLEPWLRDRVPLLYAGDQLAAVGDLWVCRDFYVEGGGGWQLRWSFKRQAASCKA